jgi:GT2 family glycosyltransferase
VRKTVFLQLKGFDESLRAGTDDVDWFFRANAAAIKTHELPEELLLRRIHDKNLSAQARAHNKELLSVVRMNIARRNAAETASMK